VFYRFYPEDLLHFLHTLDSDLFFLKHAGQTRIFFVVLLVRAEDKTAWPKMAIQTPKKRGVQCLWTEAEARTSAG
jgi:hypothetical protein